MATVKRQDVCFGTKYTDNQGNEKTSWKNVGTAFVSDQGKISIKLDSVPCGEWDGWLSLFDQREKQAPATQGYGNQQSQGGYQPQPSYQQPTTPFGQPTPGIQPNPQFGGQPQQAAQGFGYQGNQEPPF